MPRVTLIRHGQAGTRDDYDNLSGTGIRQARLLGEWLRQRGAAFDEVISGSLARQKHTAELVLGGDSARLKIDPDHETQLVLAAADAAVRQSLAFAARDFGEPVAASRVTALLQAVPGVQAVDMDTLYRALETPALQSILFAASPQSGAAGLVAAELLTLDPGGLSLEVMP